MRARAVVLAAALILAPLGAGGADLVVWWEEGYYAEEDEAVREIIAAFEQRSGKEVELVLHLQDELPDKVVARFEARRPPDFALVRSLAATSDNGPSTTGSWTFRMPSAALPPLSPPDFKPVGLREISHLTYVSSV